MEKAPDVTGLILAGGASRRFGSDKARHPVAGRPMIAHVYDVLADVADPIYVSVRAPNADTDLPVKHVYDGYPDAGPLAGLHAGLCRCATPWLLALACDMPFLTVDVLRTLLAARAAAPGPVVARTPDGRLHPLCALYPRTVLGEVGAALQSHRYALRDLLLRASPIIEIPVPLGPLRNINQPQDLP